MKYLGLLLHCYQPPWQDEENIERIVNECYQPFFDFILWHPEFKLTVNINYSLLEILEKYNQQNLLHLIRRTADLGRIELTGSGAYHPILPLLPVSEIKRQISLNEHGTEKVLGKYLRNGFFPPEMAFHPDLVKIVKKAGYRWLITDDLPFVCQHGFAPYDFISSIKGLPVFLRSRLWSQRLAFREFFSGYNFVNCLNSDLDQWFSGKNGYLVIALDIQTFCRHHRNYLNFLHEMQDGLQWQTNLRLVFISEILNHFPIKPFEIPAGSWATSEEDFKQGISFPLWWHPDNQAQQLLWTLIDLLLANLSQNMNINPNRRSRQRISARMKARELMDKALNSCQFWWLSKEHWNPEIIFKVLPIYSQIISQLNLSESILKKIDKIFKNLKEITG